MRTTGMCVAPWSEAAAGVCGCAFHALERVVPTGHNRNAPGGHRCSVSTREEQTLRTEGVRGERYSGVALLSGSERYDAVGHGLARAQICIDGAQILVGHPAVKQPRHDGVEATLGHGHLVRG